MSKPSRAAAAAAFLVLCGAGVGLLLWGGGPTPPPGERQGDVAPTQRIAREDPLLAVIDGGVSAIRDRLIELRRASASPEVNRERVRLIGALGQAKNEESLTALKALAKEEDQVEVLAAVHALWTRGERAYVLELAAQSGDRALEAKVAALEAAGQ